MPVSNIQEYTGTPDLETIMAHHPFLLKVYTDHCPLCKILDSKIQALATLRKDINIVNLNGQMYPVPIKHLGIRSVPKLYLCVRTKTNDHFFEFVGSPVATTPEKIAEFYDTMLHQNPLKD